ncbi:hypothetical protein [Pleionea litopenaei]|uniref:Uncharacterized protein n=1 Tax=Pleionea litopenaei TaxID=3070815 RepID=A0AA51RQA4_9GAMM|nr:hypothetical protein [Pleionea sp. HL-JVS1]WMS85565.1 hypothetical protein Q9312_10105 [Pleionea sp. HL-JVS1]
MSQTQQNNTDNSKTTRWVLVILLLLLSVASYFWLYNRPINSKVEHKTRPPALVERQPLKKETNANSPTSITKETVQTLPVLPIDDVKLTDVYDLPIDYFRELRSLFRQLNLPPGVQVYLDSGDLVSAIRILQSQPENPYHLLANELIQITCSAIVYDGRYLAETPNLEEHEKKELNESELEFFSRFRTRRSNASLRMQQNCNDLEIALPDAIEKQRAQLLARNQSALAQVFGQMRDLNKQQAQNLLLHAFQESPNNFLGNSLTAMLLMSDDPLDVQQGLALLDNLPQPDETVFNAMAYCLQKLCLDNPSVTQSSREIWLEKAAELGSNGALRQLSQFYEKEGQWQKDYAWQTYHLTILKTGCYASPENYLQEYSYVKKRLKLSLEQLTEEQLSNSRKVANQLFLDHLEQAQTWRGCL